MKNMEIEASNDPKASMHTENPHLKLQETLKQCIEGKSFDLLTEQWKGLEGNDGDRKSMMDLVLRKHIISLLTHASLDIDACDKCVQISISAAQSEISNVTIPSILLSDLFDSLTINQSEELFYLVEGRVETWKHPFFFSYCKNQLLRLCNDLLRRLSQSQNTVFGGRILLFLAKFFPPSERSGLNIVSEFNLDNITVFGKEDPKLTDQDVLKGKESKANVSSLVVDYNLYCKFWSLQDMFRNPNLCYNKIPWRTFLSHSNDVLEAFSSFKLDSPGGGVLKSLDSPVASRQSQCSQPQYFAKYLTSQKLLQLQMSDNNFRRYILLQYLVLFQYLRGNVKFKSESQVLDEDQLAVIDKLTEKIHTLITETPPDGEEFGAAVKHILQREEHWNLWKNEGCPEFSCPKGKETEGSQGNRSDWRSRKRAGDEMREVSRSKKICMGNAELTKLWNLCPDNSEACKSGNRDFLPSLESYFEEAINQSLQDGVKESEKKINDSNFGWRALRLLAKKSPYFFNHGHLTPIVKLSEYLDNMVKKIIKDIPQLQSSCNVTPDPRIESDTLQPVSQEADEDDELLKMKDEVKEENGDEDEIDRTGRDSLVTKEQLCDLSKNLGEDWLTLAPKLGFEEDQIEYFTTSHPDVEGQAMHMFDLWREQGPEDATVENLLYILQGLKMETAAQGVLF